MESLIVGILFIQNDKSNKKLWHYVEDPEGNVSHAPIGGSYTFPTVTEVHEYIDQLISSSS
jgi:hypothetical protein